MGTPQEPCCSGADTLHASPPNVLYTSSACSRPMSCEDSLAAWARLSGSEELYRSGYAHGSTQEPSQDQI